MRDRKRLAKPQPKPRKRGGRGVDGAKAGQDRSCSAGRRAEAEAAPGAPDPALFDLVRTLARAAAREHHAAAAARDARGAETNGTDPDNDGE